MIVKEDLTTMAIAIAGLFGMVLVLNIVLSVLAIWAINTLFGMQIPLALETVLAATILVIIFGQTKISFKKDVNGLR